MLYYQQKLEEDNDRFYFESDQALAEIGIDDVYKKLKADNLMKRIERDIKIKDGYKKDDFTFKIEKGFSNRAPLISFKYIYQYNNSVKNVYSVGVQIQGGVLKRYAETKAGKVNLLKGGYDEFFDDFAKIGLFDGDYNVENKKLRLKFCDNITEAETNMEPKKGDQNKKNKYNLMYNAFNDFVYQQIKIPNSVAELEKEINMHLEYIQSILKDAKNIFDKK